MKKLDKKNTELTLEFAKTVHHHILLFQRRMRHARLDYQSRFGHDEILLLSLIANSSGLSASEISQILVIPKARVSRYLISFETQNFIKMNSSEIDRRGKEIHFTKKGEMVFRELLEENNEISRRGIFPISGENRDFLERFLKNLNDGFGFPEALGSEGEEVLFVQQRRLSSSSGMTGVEYMESELDLLEYQIFAELSFFDKPQNFSVLEDMLPFHISKISRAISKLVKNGYLKKFNADGDKRTVICKLTSKGTQYFKEVNDIVGARYRDALIALKISDIKRFVNLIDSLKDSPIPPPTPKKLDLVICKTPDEFSKSREVLVKILVEKNRHQNMIASLIPQDRFCVQYFSGSEVVGVLVITKNAEVEYFEIDSLQDGSKDCERECFERGGEMFLDLFKFKKLQIPDVILKRID